MKSHHTPVLRVTISLLIAMALLPGLAAATPAGSPSRLEATLAQPSLLCSQLFVVHRRPLVSDESPIILAQRAIEDERRQPLPDEEDQDKEKGKNGKSGNAGQETGPTTPVPAAELGLGGREAAEVKSPVKAMLLSAALPGLGDLYAGSNRGYLFMGVEAVSWITWASFRSSADSKEEEMFGFADKNFSRDLFADKCVPQDGQNCPDAVNQLNHFYDNDKPEYYEIISKNPIYKSGWGAVAFENEQEPEKGGEEYRIWIADFAAAQDTDYIDYNSQRDDRNDLSRTARSMTIVVLLNHLASAWHSFAVAGGLSTQVTGDVEMELDLHPSLRNPGARLIVSRAF